MSEKVREIISIECQVCGTIFTMSPAEQKYYDEKGFSIPKRCPECRKTLKSNIKKIVCVDCGKEFTIDGYELEYFAKKGYELPKRCRACRDIKRKHNEELHNEQTNSTMSELQ